MTIEYKEIELLSLDRFKSALSVIYRVESSLFKSGAMMDKQRQQLLCEFL